MNTLELIDRLCAVTSMLADIVSEQEKIIAQHRYLDGEAEAELTRKRNAAYAELDLLEVGLRPIHNTAAGKEENPIGSS